MTQLCVNNQFYVQAISRYIDDFFSRLGALRFALNLYAEAL